MSSRSRRSDSDTSPDLSSKSDDDCAQEMFRKLKEKLGVEAKKKYKRLQERNRKLEEKLKERDNFILKMKTQLESATKDFGKILNELNGFTAKREDNTSATSSSISNKLSWPELSSSDTSEYDSDNAVSKDHGKNVKETCKRREKMRLGYAANYQSV